MCFRHFRIHSRRCIARMNASNRIIYESELVGELIGSDRGEIRTLIKSVNSLLSSFGSQLAATGHSPYGTSGLLKRLLGLTSAGLVAQKTAGGSGANQSPGFGYRHKKTACFVNRSRPSMDKRFLSLAGLRGLWLRVRHWTPCVT